MKNKKIKIIISWTERKGGGASISMDIGKQKIDKWRLLQIFYHLIEEIKSL